MSNEELKSCPFCGQQAALKLITAQELAEEGDDDPGPWIEAQCWAVICDGSRPKGPGGCGACGGFAETTEKAVQLWNMRQPGELPR